MTPYLRFYDNLYFNEDIQKTAFGYFEIRMARAGIVSPGDFEALRFNCIFTSCFKNFDMETFLTVFVGQ